MQTIKTPASIHYEEPRNAYCLCLWRSYEHETCAGTELSMNIVLLEKQVKKE